MPPKKKIKRIPEAQQKKEARARIGLPPDKGKTYKDYVKEARGRNKDGVYKRFLDKKYKPVTEVFESFEVLKEIEEND